ncbi:MAG: hypothetical protein ACJAZP_001827 [Psychromonas sp.]|jgi:hypothetical protein|uniref:hypothetical protein n=1 Tax=Psychromonas sp. TaxID=1884585 RepID=UPI0039E53E23
MKTFKNSICLLFVIVALSACSNSNDLEYGLSGTYAEINKMQILDPMAPENNAGIVNSLEGNVANKVMKTYQGSTYQPKEGRTVSITE